MINIIHKFLLYLKNHLSYLKDSILECFFKDTVKAYFCYCHTLL